MMDIIKGHIYRGSRPRPVGFPEVFDDRQVLFVSPTQVQYDSPTVRGGRKYPSVDRERFEKWVGEDVTVGYPGGDWMPFEARKAENR